MAIEAAEAQRVEAYTAGLLQAGAVKVAPDADHLFELRSGSNSWVYADHGESTAIAVFQTFKSGFC